MMTANVMDAECVVVTIVALEGGMMNDAKGAGGDE
jgi:hypothetical protein